MISQRNLGTCIILSIVTCGIYAVYWFYKIVDDLYTANGEDSKAGMDLLLSLVTCGIYLLYMMYKIGKMISSARERHGLPEKDDSILFLVLSLFGLSIVVYCIAQNEINTCFADKPNNGGNFN